MNKKKNAKNSGGSLELMTFILEKSFTTNETVIKQKYRLPDAHGVPREIDIYCETKVNGKLLRYAFECKDHKNAIALKDIVDFHSKISDMGIKGYFVTTSNFQSGAIQKAKALNIDLLKLKAKEVITDDIKTLIVLQRRIKIADIQVMGLMNTAIDKNDWIDKCPHCQQAISRLVEDILPLLDKHLTNGIQFVHPDFNNIKKVADTIGVANSKKIKVVAVYDDTSVTHKGTLIQINVLEITLDIWNEMYEHTPGKQLSYNYITYDNSNLIAEFSLSEFLIAEQNLIVGITKVGDKIRKMTFGRADKLGDLQTQDMVLLGHIDELGLKHLLRKVDVPKC